MTLTNSADVVVTVGVYRRTTVHISMKDRRGRVIKYYFKLGYIKDSFFSELREHCAMSPRRRMD